MALLAPQRGHRVDLLAMANDNARHSFVEKQRQSDDVEERLRDLQERLRLVALPRRIECCDISHLGGGDTVGAVVAMIDGELDKKRYRTFNVRGTAPAGPRLPGGDEGPGASSNDDYAAMYEVLARRFRRAVHAQRPPDALGAPSDAPMRLGEAEPADPSDASERGPTWDAPDLFVVDGGRGQLAVALAAAHDLGLHDLAIVALAKERENTPGRDARRPRLSAWPEESRSH